MIIKNCNIIYFDKIENGSLLIEDGKIKAINPENTNSDKNKIIDANGMYVAPGFIDVHIHGAFKCDTMDGTEQSINTIAKTIAKYGTTGFLPTTMTMPVEAINKSLKAAKKLKENGTEGAQVLGVHLEGPFISSNAIGAQNPEYLISPTIEDYNKMVEGCEDVITSITLAPEVEGAYELISYLSKKGIICSMGHTRATYNQALEAINLGASHSTHLYNAMSHYNHRETGVIGATFDSDITTEIITDGIHVSYPAIRIAYKQKGADKLLLITDAIMACGMSDGNYSLGGQEVTLKNGAVRLKNGALAGSVLTLDRAIYNLYHNSDIPLYELVRMASYNGAKHCKVENHKGLIKEGYDADLIIFDNDINIKKVFIKGKQII